MAGRDIINREAARLGITPQQLAQQLAERRGIKAPSRREIPEITGERFSEVTPFAEGLKAKVGVFASSTPEQEVDILSKLEGFEGVRQDPEIGSVVKFNGEEFAVNKPGFSAADVLKLGVQAVPFIAGGRIGAGGSSGAGLRRVLGGGAGGGAGSVTLDLISGAAGSEQGVSVPRAVFSAGAGALGEMLAPMIGAGFQFLKRRAGRTPGRGEVRELLTDIGVDPESLTDDALDALTRELDTAADPAAAVRLAEAETLPVAVPQTRGALTQIPEEQLLEESARKGAFGAPSREVVETVQREGQETLRANIPAIQSRISGGAQQVTQRGQGVAAAQQTLSAQEQELGRQVQTGFEAARGAKGGPLVKDLRGTINDIASSAADRIPFAPNAKVLSDDLRSLLVTEGDASIPARELFNWRRRASTLRNETNDNTERGALGAMIRRFDDRISDNLDAALLQGDENAAKLWSQANKARAEQGKTFQSGDIIETLTERRGKQLTVDPSEAANKLFGVSDLNLISKSNLRRDLVKIRDLLGKESDEWNAVREEAFLRFAERGEGALQGDLRQFSGAKFKNAWDMAKRKSPEVISTLFTGKEIKLIDQFGRVASRTTNPVFGGSNPSGTAAALTNIVKTAFKRPVGRLQEILTAGSDVAAGLKGASVRTAARGGIQRRPPIPIGVGAGSAAAALGASGEAGEFERRR